MQIENANFVLSSVYLHTFVGCSGCFLFKQVQDNSCACVCGWMLVCVCVQYMWMLVRVCMLNARVRMFGCWYVRVYSYLECMNEHV